MIHKLSLLWYVFLGYIYKFLVDIHLLSLPSIKKDKAANVIISLTSYGRRVINGVVYYTLVSLLRQKQQPSRIILWLDENEFSENTLPQRLKALQQKGVEICFCPNLMSYKKLIPTLQLDIDMPVVTVDDDVIYSSDTISKMMEVHQEHPADILALNASMPIIRNGIPCDYIDWVEYPKESSGLEVFPVGVGGTLYPVGSLHKDVLRIDLFQQLCPKADDIWFWFCSLLNSTNKRYVKKNGKDYSYDNLYQYFHKDSALTHVNRFGHQNDKQFHDLFEYYHVRMDENGNLTKTV